MLLIYSATGAATIPDPITAVRVANLVADDATIYLALRLRIYYFSSKKK